MALPLIVAGTVAVFIILLVLGSLASRKREEAWQQLANEIGASFVKGGMLRSSKVQLPFKDRTITMDAYSVSSGDSSTSYTRLVAPLQDVHGFQFSLSKNSLVSKLDKALSTKEYDTGDAHSAPSIAVTRLRVLLSGFGYNKHY